VIIHNPFPLALGLIRVKTFYTIGADALSEFSKMLQKSLTKYSAQILQV